MTRVISDFNVKGRKTRSRIDGSRSSFPPSGTPPSTMSPLRAGRPGATLALALFSGPTQVVSRDRAHRHHRAARQQASHGDGSSLESTASQSYNRTPIHPFQPRSSSPSQTEFRPSNSSHHRRQITIQGLVELMERTTYQNFGASPETCEECAH